MGPAEPVLGGPAEGTVVVRSREEEAEGKSHCYLQVLDRRLKGSGSCSLLPTARWHNERKCSETVLVEV